MNRILIYGGGTISHVRPHLALSAPAYGATARKIEKIIANINTLPAETRLWLADTETELVLTRMAGGDRNLETNGDVAKDIADVLTRPSTKLIFLSTAFCDFDGAIGTSDGAIMSMSGKDQPRLRTDGGNRTLHLTPAEKVISRIRKTRKDVFLVGFKTTAGATTQQQFEAGLKLLKTSSCNLVLANDVHTRLNMVVTPEEVPYGITKDRNAALRELVEMALLRADLTFTRSTVVDSPVYPWDRGLVPENLYDVVNDCIRLGAYKPFLGKTVGHFAFRHGGDIITSIRKSNFNDLPNTGMVRIQTHDDDRVTAYGAKPSVGGQSQRIIFREHGDVDGIVHFHCPVKPGVDVPTVDQRPYECGSHECGANTSQGLREVEHGGQRFKVVYLDGHGPNIVFSKSTNPAAVSDYINSHFDLSVSTGSARIREFEARA